MLIFWEGRKLLDTECILTGEESLLFLSPSKQAVQTLTLSNCRYLIGALLAEHRLHITPPQHRQWWRLTVSWNFTLQP